MAPSGQVTASLFATCMVDQLYPQVGVSVVRVLRRLGVKVQFPAAQVCCGQPLYNAGFTKPARQLARGVLRSLAGSQYVVVPSGSCAAMLRVFYLDLLAHDPALLPQAQALASRVYEFSQFLTDVLGVEDVGARYTGKAAYHPSCHLLRELGVGEGPRRLLSKVQGLESVELPQAETCCGFGGAFSVKFPHISGGMLDDKLANLKASGADTLVACDMGCLMHLGGAIDRRSLPVRARHLAQVLDGEAR